MSTTTPAAMGVFAASIVHTILGEEQTRWDPLESLPTRLRVCKSRPPPHPPGLRPGQGSTHRLQVVRSPGGHGVALWLKGAVLLRHGDLLDVIRSDPQIGPEDSDPNAPAQWARFRMDLESAEPG